MDWDMNGIWMGYIYGIYIEGYIDRDGDGQQEGGGRYGGQGLVMGRATLTPLSLHSHSFTPFIVFTSVLVLCECSPSVAPGPVAPGDRGGPSPCVPPPPLPLIERIIYLLYIPYISHSYPIHIPIHIPYISQTGFTSDSWSCALFKEYVFFSFKSAIQGITGKTCLGYVWDMDWDMNGIWMGYIWDIH